MQKLSRYLLLAFLFLLPWQTRYIWHYGELNSGYWEYGTFSIYATEILLWIILILFFVQHFLRKEFWARLKEKPQRISLILLLLVLALSMALSKNFWISYYFIFKFLEAMALMTVLMWEKDKTNYQFALWAGAVLQGVLAVWQFLTQHVWASKWLGMAGQEGYNLGPSVIEFADQRWLRAYGSFGSPNSLGIYLAVLFVLGLILYLKSDSPKIKIAISVGQLFVLSGLLLSFSRAAWLAATVGTVSLFVLIFLKQKQWLSSFGKQAAFAVAVIIFWLVIFYPVFSARFNLSNRLESQSISERKDQYGEVLSFIKSNPVLGVGPGAYTHVLYTKVFSSLTQDRKQVFSPLTRLENKKYPTLQSWQVQPVHNIYLLALVEIGFAGVIFLFFLFKYLFVKIYRDNLIYLPIILTLIFAGLFDHWLWSMYTGIIFFWVVWGILYKNKQME